MDNQILCDDEKYHSLILDYLENLESITSTRKRELSRIYSLVTDSDIAISYRQQVLRLSIVSLYSNYEGFLYDIFRETIILLEKCQLNYKHIKEGFITLYITPNIGNIKSQHRQSSKIISIFNNINSKNFFDSLLTSDKKNGKNIINHSDIFFIFNIFLMSKEIIIKSLNTIDISNELKDFLNISKVPFIEFNEKNIEDFKETVNLKLENLYKRRNSIAHGDSNMSVCGPFTSHFTKPNESIYNNAIKEFRGNYHLVMFLLDFIENTFYIYIIEKDFLKN